MNPPDKIYILCNDNGDLGDVSLYPEERSKEYLGKKPILDFLGKVLIEVNSFTHSVANDFRAEGANKVITLIKDYIESL